MLLGQYITSLSSSRRLAVPKQLRSELGKKFIISKWYEGCLVLVSFDRWKGLLERVTGKMEFVTQPVRDTDRFIMGSAFELRPDAQGRVIMPEMLSSYAKLKSEVVFIGLGDRVEVWDKTEWTAREQYVQSHAGVMMEEIAKKNA
ncbi:hypothetical protein C4564_01200 [Candidatus Microgenomates bacterium]|nr:MAG: hypothetical protein C4564_01200 [Candidatus Microgenomates bacterium]